ncbi:hypothetical protein RRH01S_29_00530 [Rhizobium rhizogenes NBRC 13257]|uniref:Uncharacterized protein n=2 Tax=Rhizobium rhizogenes TaxID=359 RepID=A0AA87QDM5_RHIRH|nr:hypothetical protein RRH01S_29_00530 [Rhizobium rhizogenes NBRC 13257]
MHRIPARWQMAVDFSAQLRLRANEIEGMAANVRSIPNSNLQRYLIRRLHGRMEEQSWLDTMPLQAAIHFTELLGASIKHGCEPGLETFQENDWAVAAEEGFAVVTKGQQAVKQVLRTIARKELVAQKCTLPILFGRLAVEFLARTSCPGYLDLIHMLEELAVSEFPSFRSEF